ncbi:MAG: hypothetical protein M3275_00720 [Thermoproteota archaeon]|nr:hypothetical protein [Thermoproteota archaeon]MDQ3966900.1 hypothetical protein [Thermoproteota archaeon]
MKPSQGAPAGSSSAGTTINPPTSIITDAISRIAIVVEVSSSSISSMVQVGRLQ